MTKVIAINDEESYVINGDFAAKVDILVSDSDETSVNLTFIRSNLNDRILKLVTFTGTHQHSKAKTFKYELIEFLSNQSPVSTFEVNKHLN